MKIRDFRQADFKMGLLECLNALSPTAFTSDAVPYFAAQRKARGVRTFVAVARLAPPPGKSRVRQAVVGTCSVFVEPKFIHGGSWVGHVEDVAVHPDWQGHGIGTALVRHAVDVCRKAGCYKVILDCSPGLRPFYERVGFYHNGAAMRLDLDPEKV